MNPQNGFTLVELIIALAMIMVLGAIALPEFQYARDDAYLNASASAIRTALTAMEAGKGTQDFDTVQFLWQDEPGPPQSASGQALAPGFVVPENAQVFLYYNPNCHHDGCVRDYAYTRHCAARSYRVFYRTGGSVQLTYTVHTTPGC